MNDNPAYRSEDPCGEEELRASEARMRLITRQLPAMLWSTDRELRVTMAHGAMLPILGLPPEQVIGSTVLDVVGAEDLTHPEVTPYLRALAGESVAYETTFAGHALDVHLEPLRNTAGEVIGTVGVCLDITARKQAEALHDGAQRELQEAYQSLEQRVAERTRELSTLLKISSDIASTLELRPLIRLILDRLEAVTHSSGAALSIVDGEDMIFLDSRGVSEAELASGDVEVRYPATRLGAIWEAIRQGQAVIINNVRDDSPLAVDYRKALGPLAESALRDVGSWLGVPMLRHGRVTGLLSESYAAPHYYTPHHAELAAAIAHQAAIAIENARLYEQAQEEARKTAALARIASSLALGGPLEPALDAVAQNVVEASGAVACSLLVTVHSPARLQVLGSYGQPEGYRAAHNAVLRNMDAEYSVESHDDSRIHCLRNARAYALSHPEYAPIYPFMPVVAWDTLVSLPAIYQGRNVARLNLYYRPEDEPGEAEMAFLSAIADQAAIATENARLYAEAEAKAALEERQRLARELHDSVSQALYSIMLGAETAREYLQIDPSRAAGPLEYVRSLANAGLAEMKALIFELRPESLEKEGLVAALTKQAAALQARHALDVTTELAAEPSLPLDAKEALYRIAQEALHNVVKHAEATHVEVRLACSEDQAILEVRDNGLGFDPAGQYPGHLGLKSMCERAWRAGGALFVDSAPGRGACVRATLPLVAQ